MSVQTTTTSVTYSLVTTPGVLNAVNFSIPFPFQAQADIVAVTAPTSGGTPYTLRNGIDFTTTGQGSPSTPPGTLTLTATGQAIINNTPANIVISRSTALTQPTALPSQGPFPSPAVEGMVDRVTLAAQEIANSGSSNAAAITALQNTTASLQTQITNITVPTQTTPTQLFPSAAALPSQTLTVDLSKGTEIHTVLDANLTVAAPTNTPGKGTRVRHTFAQDATGARGITWNAAWHGVSNILPRQGAGQYCAFTFVSNGDGTYSLAGHTAVDSTRPLDPRDWGAVGDAGTDDTVAIQNTINAAISLQTSVVLRKVHAFSGSLLVGARFVNEADVTFAICGGAGKNAPSYSSTTELTARVFMPSILGEEGSGLWWKGSNPASETAMLYYSAVPDLDGNTFSPAIDGVTFYGPDEMTTGGALTHTTASVSTNVSGIFSMLSPVSIRNCVFRGLNRGIIRSDCYWAKDEKLRITRCVDGYTHFQANATKGSQILVESAQGNAFTFTGQGFAYDHLNTENCAAELFLPAGDNWSISDCYWEDTVTRSTALYGSTIGNVSDGSALVTWGHLSNIHYDRKTHYFKFRSAQAIIENCRSEINDGSGTGSTYSFSRIDDQYCGIMELMSHVPWDPAGNTAAAHHGLGVGGSPDTITGRLALLSAQGQSAPAAGLGLFRFDNNTNHLQFSENGNGWTRAFYNTLQVGVNFKTASATLDDGASLTCVDATTGACIITLPSLGTCVGRGYAVKKTDATANTVTVKANGTEKIDDSNTVILANQHDHVFVISDGSGAWQIVALSSALEVAGNTSGKATISNSATTASVVFPTAEPDANYLITLSSGVSVGTPAAGSLRASWSSKSTAGFTVALEVAPGTSNTVEVDWSISRP